MTTIDEVPELNVNPVEFRLKPLLVKVTTELPSVRVRVAVLPVINPAVTFLLLVSNVPLVSVRVGVPAKTSASARVTVEFSVSKVKP